MRNLSNLHKPICDFGDNVICDPEKPKWYRENILDSSDKPDKLVNSRARPAAHLS